jgi:hypothetical protein
MTKVAFGHNMKKWMLEAWSRCCAYSAWDGLGLFPNVTFNMDFSIRWTNSALDRPRESGETSSDPSSPSTTTSRHLPTGLRLPCSLSHLSVRKTVHPSCSSLQALGKK